MFISLNDTTFVILYSQFSIKKTLDGVSDGVLLCCPFSHGVSWMILNLIESVSEGFPTYTRYLKLPFILKNITWAFPVFLFISTPYFSNYRYLNENFLGLENLH